MTRRVTPNGTTLIADGPFLLDGFLATRETTEGGPFEPMEHVRLTTLDRRRTVALWINGRGNRSGMVCHYRDRGDDTLPDAELADVVAHARARWPWR